MKNTFYSTAKKGNEIIKEIIEKKLKNKKYTLTFPPNHFSYYDAELSINGKNYLIEHKKRNFGKIYLKYFYNNKLLLEKRKYDDLIEIMNEKKFDDIVYITTLTDSHFLYKLSKVTLKMDKSLSPLQTCGNISKYMKNVYYLNIDEAKEIKY